MVVFRCRARVVDSAQSLLTWVMMGAFASVVVSGMQHVQLGLLVRSDWAGFPSSFAVILQLLSFAEVLSLPRHAEKIIDDGRSPHQI